ncbi:MAG: ABC transporter substrate-binding protein [Egibacteraceae bacterium]
MSRRMALAAALAALTLLAAACAGSAPDRGELVWAAGGSEAQPGGSYHDTVEMWNQLHPNGPKVRIETLPDSTNDQRQQLSLALNAQSPDFDILALDMIWTGEFAENGWLQPLEDLRPQLEKVSFPGLFQSATWRRKLWAVPYSGGAGFLYYRTDLVDRLPKTWDELMRVGLAVGKEHGIAPFVGQGAQYEGMVVNFLEYLWGAGGELFDKDGRVLFQEGPALKAIGFMRTAQHEGFYAPGFNTMHESDAINAFQSGNAVFMRGWPYAYRLMIGSDPRNPSVVAGKFGIAPLPTFTGEGTASTLGGFNLAVSKFSTKTDLAKEFVRFASTNPDVQRNLGRRSLAPTLVSVYDDLAGDPVMALLSQVLPDAKPRPSTPDWSAISNQIQKEVFPAYNGQRDPRVAVAAIRAFLESTVSKARSS